MTSHTNAGRRRILLVVLVAVAIAVGIAYALRNDGDSSAGAAGHAGDDGAPPAGSGATGPSALPSPSSSAPFVRTDRTVKADLLDDFPRAPQLLILGGSRATRFEPAYLEKLTGKRGFNLALQNGRPEDAWAFLNYIIDEHPGARPRVVWFIHVEAFRAQGLSAGLIQDERLARFFPDALLDREREKLPKSAAELPPGRDLALTTYGRDGVVVRNRYDIREEQGYTLDKALAWSIGKATERYANADPALDPRSMKYFDKTMALLNKLDVTPAVVLMPLHPDLLAAVRDLGWDARHREVLEYLADLQGRRDFVTLDLSRLESVGGDPDDFYDGFHVKRGNARRVLATVVREAPVCFR